MTKRKTTATPEMQETADRLTRAMERNQTAQPRNQQQPALDLLVALGSFVVHVDEVFENTHGGRLLETLYPGAQADVYAIRSILETASVKAWVRDMGALLPLKRSKR